MYYKPKNIQELLELKQRLGKEGTIVAGGTDLVVGRRKNRVNVKNYIDISAIPEMDKMEEDGNYLKIGSKCTHSELEKLSFKALRDAAETVGGPQIRNLGTVGGQLGTASPAGDVSVALTALKADVELMNTEGIRRLPLKDFFVGPGKTVIKDDEIITAVYVPQNRHSLFYKIGKRGAVAISLVMVAVSIDVDQQDDVGICVGCAAPIPLRITKAEEYCKSNRISDEGLVAVQRIVEESVSPISDHRGGADYRRAMSGTLAKRLLSQLLKEGNNEQ